LNFRDSIGREIHVKEINELRAQNYDVWLSADEWSKRRGAGEEKSEYKEQP